MRLGILGFELLLLVALECRGPGTVVREVMCFKEGVERWVISVKIGLDNRRAVKRVRRCQEMLV